MIAMPDPASIFSTIAPLLERTPEDPRPIVVMMCGLAGAGKSTLSHYILDTHPNTYTRLSIDEIVHKHHGLYNIDYPPNLHERYQDEAADLFEKRLEELLLPLLPPSATTANTPKNIVLDRAFYAKEDRECFQRLIESKNARWVLVYLKCKDKEALWKRIEGRRETRQKGELCVGREGDAAFDVTRQVLDRYWDGFEEPRGEGEVVVEVC